jgi:hypothetical protein
MIMDLLVEAGPADEMDVEPGNLPASADEAADRPGAEDDDLDQPRPR